jgi:4-hydroxybenzoate polyprenyltransferase
MNRLGQLVLSSRPLSWINTAYPFAAAYLLTTRELDLTFWLGTLYFLIPYNLAMYGINDVFDYESDLRNPRKGGVEGAVLDRRMHRLTIFAAIVTNVPFLVYLRASGSRSGRSSTRSPRARTS